MYLAGLYVYPVKSLGGMAVEQWPVGPEGLAFDRRWMVVTQEGMFLTQREVPAMARIRAHLAWQDALEGRAELILLDEQGEALRVTPPGGDAPRLWVTVWNDEVPALRVDPQADAWLSRRLGVSCTLVYFPQKAHRPLSTRHGMPGEGTWFADCCPVHVLSQASVEDLSRRVGRRVDVRRFRPNVVVAETPPYAEDRWQRIRIGQVPVRMLKPCARCSIITVNPDTGQRDGEDLLAALAGYRRQGEKALFGQYGVPEARGIWQVGMPVEVL